MKKCPKCNSDIQENARFCLYCMTSFEEKQKISIISSKKKRYIILIIAVLFLLVLSSIIMAVILQGQNNENSFTGEIVSHEVSYYSADDSDLSHQSIESRDESDYLESSQISDTSTNFVEPESSEDSSSEPEISQDPKTTYVVTDTITAELVGSTLTVNGTGNLPGRTMGYSQYPWHDDRNKITAIIINNGITEIGSESFKNHFNVKSLKIPDSVTVISHGAFQECYALESVKIPESVKTIGDYAFSDCSSLKSVDMSDGLLNIGRCAFSNCYKLTSINIPNSVVYMGDATFSDCKSLTSVVLSEGVERIRWCAFSNCSALKKIEIPSGVSCIENSAFSGCTSLSSIVIPNSITDIGSAFYMCSFDSIIVESGNTFYHSENNCLIETASKTLLLGSKNGVIPSDGSVTSISSGAFFDVSNVKSITIPKSITKINRGAFSQCESLESIIVESGNTFYHSQNNCLIETESKVLLLGCKYSIIPTDGSVTSIGLNAFNGCTSLESIKIPSSVILIENKAFEGCSLLSKVEFSIPDGWFLNTMTITELPALNDSETNAKYLKETYVSNIWKRK